jgi:hypothetical protein
VLLFDAKNLSQYHEMEVNNNEERSEELWMKTANEE